MVASLSNQAGRRVLRGLRGQLPYELTYLLA